MNDVAKNKGARRAQYASLRSKGKTYREIADEMGVSKQAVQQSLKRMSQTNKKTP